MASLFAVVIPRMLPIKQLLATSAPELPMEMTLLAVVTLLPAPSPRAVLPWPEVLKPSAPEPMAVLPLPVMLAMSALRPLAVLSTPVVLAASAPRPVAVLSAPMVLLRSAPAPTAVLLPTVVAKSVPAPGGITACCGRKECPSAERRVEAAGGVAIEREEANCCIELAGGEGEQSVLPFRSVAIGISSIGRRTDRLRCRRNRKAGEGERNQEETDPQRRPVG